MSGESETVWAMSEAIYHSLDRDQQWSADKAGDNRAALRALAAFRDVLDEHDAETSRAILDATIVAIRRGLGVTEQ